MAYPTTIDAPGGTAAQGTNLLTSPDHAQDHRILGSAIIAIETTVGTTLGTNVLKNFAAGDFPARINASNVLQQSLTGTFGINSGSITGQLSNTGTIANGVYGTPTIDVIGARNSGTAIGFVNSIYPAMGTIIDVAGGTFTVNAQTAQVYYSVMGTGAGNRTINTPTNLSAYQQLTFNFKTSGSANGTLVWGTVFRISQDTGTPTLGTGVGWNTYSWRYNAIDSKFDFLGQVLNLI